MADRVAEQLRGWGIVEVLGDYRGARIEQEIHFEQTVTVERRRSSFTVECLDCGPAPHVTPDDQAIGVCLRCGRDQWL